MLQITVTENSTLKEFTDNYYAQASFYFTTLLKEKEIKVNGVKVSKDVPVYQNDVISYYLTPKQASKPAYHILYEDDGLVIVDKESGVNSEAVFHALEREQECYFIHRLDRNTQGLLVFAKTAAFNAALLKAFKLRSVEKDYLALCFYPFKKDADVLTAYLKKDAKSALVKVSDNPANGEKIITEYKVLESRGDISLVKVRLHTGKTHQIRAHLAYIGHPIVGDMRYGDEQKNKEYKLSRQALIAKELTFYEDGVLAYLKGKTFTSKFEL